MKLKPDFDEIDSLNNLINDLYDKIMNIGPVSIDESKKVVAQP